MAEKKSAKGCDTRKSGKSGKGSQSFWQFLKKNWRLSFELRKVLLAIPVVVMMIGLANECRQRLPELVGINLMENGGFEQMMNRDNAIAVMTTITVLCLVFMFFSRKTIYPWLISLMSLLLPVLLIVTNIFPA